MPSHQITLVLLFLQILLASFASANLQFLPNGTTWTSFDFDWRMRPPKDFDVTGALTSAISFGSGCVATNNSILAGTEIIHIHLPNVTASDCNDIATIADSLNQMYSSGYKFAALLVTVALEEKLGTEKWTPWGDPTLVLTTPFGLAVGPLSTAVGIWSVTKNYTINNTMVRMVSDMGPWNGRLKGTAATIYNALLTCIYVVYFGYTLWFHFSTYKHHNRCIWPPHFKSWIFITLQLYLGFQIIYMWIPLYPGIVSNIFYWYSYFFGFIGYTLMLLTWVRVVSSGKATRKTFTVNTLKAIWIFCYIAMAIVFLAFTFAVVAIAYPQNQKLQTVKTTFYYLIPIVLVTQTVLFSFYGIRLIRTLKTFSMTEEKRDLIKKMSVLMVCTASFFLISAIMTIMVIFFNDTLLGAWASRIGRDSSLVLVLVAIFLTLRSDGSSRGSKYTRKSTTVSTPRKGSLHHSSMGTDSSGDIDVVEKIPAPMSPIIEGTDVERQLSENAYDYHHLNQINRGNRGCEVVINLPEESPPESST